MSYKNYQPLRLVEKLSLFDIPLEVHFFYYAPIKATEFEPPCDEDIEVESILVETDYGELDLYRLFGEKAMAKLYEELYKIIDQNKKEKF